VTTALKRLVTLRDHRLSRALDELRLARLALEKIDGEIARMRAALANARAQAATVMSTAYQRRVAGTSKAAQWENDSRLRASWDAQHRRADNAIAEQEMNRVTASTRVEAAQEQWQAATKASEAIQAIQQQNEKARALIMNNLEEEQIEDDFSSAKSKDLAHA
jgi:flagellar biosynthesis chaperone FliJ